MITLALLLSGCRSDGSDSSIYEEQMDRIVEDDIVRQEALDEELPPATVIDESTVIRRPSAPLTEISERTKADGEHKELIIYNFTANKNPSFDMLYILAQRFMKLHPDVKIIIQSDSLVIGDFNASVEKYTTRTMTALAAGTSVDIIDFTFLPVGKINGPGYFANIRDFMDNDAGFNPDDFYSNVFDATTENGYMWSFPLSFRYDLLSIHTELAALAGIDFSSPKPITYKEALDIYDKVKATDMSSENLYLWAFSCIEEPFVYNWDTIVDMQTNTVTMDTPEFRSILERMLAIPVYEKCVSYSPGGLMQTSTDDYSANNRAVFYNGSIADTEGISRLLPHIYDNRNRFSENLVPIKYDDGSMFFMPSRCYGITKQCPEKELAWEFLKFIATGMTEYTDDVVEPMFPHFLYESSWPVNKVDFRNTLRLQFDEAIAYSNGRYNFMNDDYQAVLESMYERLDEWNRQCNRAVSYDYTLEAELMWPDLYQLISGKQSVDMTLANLQSRLEIYLSE